MPIVLIATLTPLPEHREEVRAALMRVVPIVHEEAGCEVYALHESRTSFVLVEQWRDRDALAKHAEGEALTALQRELEGLLEAPMDVQSLRPILAGSAARGSLSADGP